jgi:hypothetical protein
MDERCAKVDRTNKKSIVRNMSLNKQTRGSGGTYRDKTVANV